jgi:hypothetical protein
VVRLVEISSPIAVDTIKLLVDIEPEERIRVYMHKTRLLSLSLISLLALLVVAFGVMITRPTDVSHAQQLSNSVVQTGSLDPHALGLPAITPRNTAVGASTPTFTTDDVVQYVHAHPMPDASLSGPKPVITRIAFLTSREVSTRLKGESTGVPDDTLLCYVELSGTFTFSGSSGVTVTYHTGVEVFDAHTGNLLITGGQ